MEISLREIIINNNLLSRSRINPELVVKYREVFEQLPLMYYVVE